MKSSIEKIKSLRHSIVLIDIEIEKEVKKSMPEFGIEHTLGHWKCKESPVGVCVYNHFKDRAFDNCLFCEEPHERK